MDKRKVEGKDTTTCGNRRTISQGDPEENPRSITVWKDDKHWLIYDQTNDIMTQGKSYRDAIFMLSDALKCMGIK